MGKEDKWTKEGSFNQKYLQTTNFSLLFTTEDGLFIDESRRVACEQKLQT